MATASFSSGDQGDEVVVETFDPMIRAVGRLQTKIFEIADVAISIEQSEEILFDLLPYIDCHLSLYNAERAVTEIGRRTGVIPNEEEG